MEAQPSRVRGLRAGLLVALAVYLGSGLVFALASLVCYNLRNWGFYGGWVFPPLYLLGLPLELFVWPVFLRANLINSLGVFGSCPLP